MLGMCNSLISEGSDKAKLQMCNSLIGKDTGVKKLKEGSVIMAIIMLMIEAKDILTRRSDLDSYTRYSVFYE